MKAVQTGQAHARRAAGSNGNGHGLVSELDALRATCQRQAHVLDKLYAAVSALHRGAAALKAENAELRAAVATTPQSAAHAAPGVNVAPPGIASWRSAFRWTGTPPGRRGKRLVSTCATASQPQS